MSSNPVGKIFDIQRYTLHDGPGIRTGVFTQGCHLHCPWCHSPDSQPRDGILAWFSELCVGVEKCGQCLKVCPTSALTPGERVYAKFIREEIQLVHLDRGVCIGCMRCAEVCSPKALYNTARVMSVDDVMHVIDKDKAFYRRSNGGVTISGGEPMLQEEFVGALLQRCKEEGLHTALDTSGAVPWESYAKIAGNVDLVLYDLKCMDDKKSEDLIGYPSGPILENARRFAKRGNQIQIRYPVIPGYNDDEENAQAAAAFCASLGKAVQAIQILPYHRLGIPKYERIGAEYSLKDTLPPQPERLNHIRSLFTDKGMQLQQ